MPLVVALIAGSASLAGVLYNQHSAGLLERSKWEQTQKDALYAVVVDFAKELTAAHQRAEWMVWSAKNTTDALTQKDFESFDVEAKLSLPKIFGYRVLLTAKRPEAYKALAQVVNGYFAADECVGLAGAEFRRDKTKGTRALIECGKTVKQVTDGLAPAFTVAMREAEVASPTAIGAELPHLAE